MSRRWTLLASRLNPSCRDAMGLFSRSLDRELSRTERIIGAIHLLHCPACRRSRRQFFLLASTLRHIAGQPACNAAGAIPGLPRAVRERIKRALRRE